MAELVIVGSDSEPDEDFVVSVEPESEDHHVVVEFDRRHARFVYGPRTFASRKEAVHTAADWADQYGIARVYVH